MRLGMDSKEIRLCAQIFVDHSWLNSQRIRGGGIWPFIELDGFHFEMA